MSAIDQQLRNKRFNVKTDSGAKLVVESITGDRHEFKLSNASLTGVGAVTDAKLTDEGLFIGNIIPAAKIVFNSQEFSLGRLVLRTTSERNAQTHLGFSTVDVKVPMEGALSKCFDIVLGEDASPLKYELNPDRFSLANFSESSADSTDLFAKVKTFNIFMEEWQRTPKFSYFQVRQPSSGSRVNLKRGRRNGRNDYIIMGSNDYLGLASHPEVREAAKKAIDDFGFGSTGSPVTTGLTSLHEELSDTLARMLRKEKVILYNSGYAANIGLISSLTRSQDLIVADMLSHASIADGMQMSKASSRFFLHNDVKHLDKILNEHRGNHAGCLVVTEGIFSMDGHVAPLDKIIEVARKHQARIMVDEAHSFGILGANGYGAVEKFNVMEKVDMVMGTFSKICGGIGGFVACDADVYNWLYVLSRAHMFSVSLPPSTCAAALKALQIFSTQKHLLQDVRRNIKHFVSGLINLGFDLDPNHESSVVPVIIGDERKLGLINEILMDSGVYVVPIVFPGVPRETCRFRFTVMATHTLSDLDYVLNLLEGAMARVDFTPASAPSNRRAA